MTIVDFINNYKSKRFINTPQGENERSEYICKTLEVKTYIPFRQKREIAEMIVSQNIKEVDGIKKYDDINSYVSLIVASIVAHTNLEFGTDVIADYDILAESGLLSQIITEFQDSHEEIGILLKMAIAAELEDNNISVLVGHFLNNILKKLDVVGSVLRDKLDDFDIKDVLGDFKQEDLTRFTGFLDKIT